MSFTLPSALRVRALLTVIGCYSVICGSTALAQCPDGGPETLPNGVIEGLVSCSFDESSNASVGFDENGRFLVAWQTPMPTAFTLPIHLFVHRFDDEGSYHPWKGSALSTVAAIRPG